MTQNNISTTKRLDVVDALRGFALLAIILLHNTEHYNLYFFPENMPDWLNVLDKGVWDSVWFMMAGKAFSTFSLLFGFSYYIQLSNRQREGKPFGLRFAWRMVILLIISQLHALFYNGDILFMYALMGFVLIPISKLSNRWILTIATIFLLQPMELWRIINTIINPNNTPFDYGCSYYGEQCREVMINGNFIETIHSNITDGQLYSNLWQVSAGRLFQIPSLFMFGLLAGRIKCFEKSKESTQLWITLATISIISLLLPLNILKNYIPDLIDNERILSSYNAILLSLWNFTFMLAIISLFTLLWFSKEGGYKFQRFIIPFGRMSLTNYISQSIIGCAIYLNWGLGLYKYSGATVSILIGLTIFTIQLFFSRWWLKEHKQGILEWAWKKLTWIKF